MPSEITVRRRYGACALAGLAIGSTLIGADIELFRQVGTVVGAVAALPLGGSGMILVAESWPLGCAALSSGNYEEDYAAQTPQNFDEWR